MIQISVVSADRAGRVESASDDGCEAAGAGSSKKNDTHFACRSFWYVPLPALWIESEEQVSLYRLAWPKMVFSSPRRSIHIYQHRFFEGKIIRRRAAYSCGLICLLKGYFLDIAQVSEN